MATVADAHGPISTDELWRWVQELRADLKELHDGYVQTAVYIEAHKRLEDRVQGLEERIAGTEARASYWGRWILATFVATITPLLVTFVVHLLNT